MPQLGCDGLRNAEEKPAIQAKRSDILAGNAWVADYPDLCTLCGSEIKHPMSTARARPAERASPEWDNQCRAFCRSFAGIPSPLSIGTVELEDGSEVHGFLLEAAGFDGATDISDLGSWRSYLASMKSASVA